MLFFQISPAEIVPDFVVGGEGLSSFEMEESGLAGKGGDSWCGASGKECVC